jgi:hypothetical protein
MEGVAARARTSRTGHDLIMTQQPVPDAALVEIVDKIFLPLVSGS